MQLNKNTVHAKLHKFTYCSEELPDNLCNYFWECVISIVLFPFTLITLPFKMENIIERVILSFTLWVLVVIYFVGIKHVWTEHNSLWLAFLWPVILIGIMFVVFGSIFGIYFGVSAFFKKSLVGSYLTAKKEQYCPKIDWNKDEAN